MPNKEDLKAYLSHHIGAARGISVEQLADALLTDARHVRHLVTELRMDGVAVCATPSEGYFIAETHEELERTLNNLRSRAMRSLVLESQLRHVPLPELLGQLRLKT